MRPQNNTCDLAVDRLVLSNGPVPGQAMTQNQKSFLIQLMYENSLPNMSTPETEYWEAKLPMRLSRAASSRCSGWALNLPTRFSQHEQGLGVTTEGD